jgi:hypothetical protein
MEENRTTPAHSTGRWSHLETRLRASSAKAICATASTSRQIVGGVMLEVWPGMPT